MGYSGLGAVVVATLRSVVSDTGERAENQLSRGPYQRSGRQAVEDFTIAGMGSLVAGDAFVWYSVPASERVP
jgi:hypothetical protein